MTIEEAYKGLQNNKDLLEWIDRVKECPDASHNQVQEIWSYYKEINPTYRIDWCCSSCVFAMLVAANRVRKENELKFYTFNK